MTAARSPSNVAVPAGLARLNEATEEKVARLLHEVHFAADRPYGLIEATILRDGVAPLIPVD